MLLQLLKFGDHCRRHDIWPRTHHLAKLDKRRPQTFERETHSFNSRAFLQRFVPPPEEHAANTLVPNFAQPDAIDEVAKPMIQQHGRNFSRATQIPQQSKRTAFQCPHLLGCMKTLRQFIWPANPQPDHRRSATPNFTDRVALLAGPAVALRKRHQTSGSLSFEMHPGPECMFRSLNSSLIHSAHHQSQHLQKHGTCQCTNSHELWQRA